MRGEREREREEGGEGGEGACIIHYWTVVVGSAVAWQARATRVSSAIRAAVVIAADVVSPLSFAIDLDLLLFLSVFLQQRASSRRLHRPPCRTQKASRSRCKVSAARGETRRGRARLGLGIRSEEKGILGNRLRLLSAAGSMVARSPCPFSVGLDIAQERWQRRPHVGHVSWAAYLRSASHL